MKTLAEYADFMKRVANQIDFEYYTGWMEYDLSGPVAQHVHKTASRKECKEAWSGLGGFHKNFVDLTPVCLSKDYKEHKTSEKPASSPASMFWYWPWIMSPVKLDELDA